VIHVVVLLAALTVAAAAELVGVARHEHGKVDTYTEMVRWLGDRIGPWAFPLGIFLVGLLTWSIPHLWLALNDKF
jgi:hypothetical protein